MKETCQLHAGRSYTTVFSAGCSCLCSHKKNSITEQSLAVQQTDRQTDRSEVFCDARTCGGLYTHTLVVPVVALAASLLPLYLWLMLLPVTPSGNFRASCYPTLHPYSPCTSSLSETIPYFYSIITITSVPAQVITSLSLLLTKEYFFAIRSILETSAACAVTAKLLVY